MLIGIKPMLIDVPCWPLLLPNSKNKNGKPIPLISDE